MIPLLKLNPQLFQDPVKQSYLNFSYLDSDSIEKLLSVFDVFVFNSETSSFELLHLDSSSIFADNLFDSQTVSLVLVPCNINNLNLNSLLTKQEIRPILAPGAFPLWNMKSSRFGFRRYDLEQMMTTDIMLPFPSVQSSFFKRKSFSIKNSNEISQTQIFNTFRKIHFRQPVQEWPVSVDLRNLGALTTSVRPQSILLKVFVPHLKVLYNHSFFRLDSLTPLDQVWLILSKTLKMNNFYLFHEIDRKLTSKDKKSPLPNLELLQSPVENSSSDYWGVLKKILEENLLIKTKSQSKTSQFVLKDILGSSSSTLKSLILVPAIQFLFPNFQIRPKLSESLLLTKQMQTLGKSSQESPCRQDSQIEQEPPKTDITLSTGKRAFPGLSPPNSQDSESTKKNLKKVQTDTVGETSPNFPVSGNVPFKLKSSLLYLDLSIILDFLDLFKTFETGIYINVSKPDTKLYRKMLVSGEISDKKLFKVLYRRFLNEKHYLSNLIHFNQEKKVEENLFPNGNLFYGNTDLDKHWLSIGSDIPEGIDKTNPDFHNIKCKLFSF